MLFGSNKVACHIKVECMCYVLDRELEGKYFANTCSSDVKLAASAFCVSGVKVMVLVPLLLLQLFYMVVMVLQLKLQEMYCVLLMFVAFSFSDFAFCLIILYV